MEIIKKKKKKEIEVHIPRNGESFFKLFNIFNLSFQTTKREEKKNRFKDRQIEFRCRSIDRRHF